MPKFKKMIHHDFFGFLDSLAKAYSNRPAVSCFQNDEWNIISFIDLKTEAIRIAGQLQMAGIKPKENIAILGESSVEWVVHFFAVLLAGGVAIPLDVKLTEAELENIIRHSEPSMILASSKFREIARKLRTVPSHVAKVLVMSEPAKSTALNSSFTRVHIQPEETVIICYTSGTSGTPKGVMISLKAVLFEIESMYRLSHGVDETDVMLSVLPLNHLFGLGIGLLLSLRCGMEFCMAHELGPDAIKFCMQARQVSNFQVVPLFLKILMRSIRQQAFEAVGEKKFNLSLKFSRMLKQNALKRLVFKKIHTEFGGNLRRFICGGSELDPEIFDFFSAIGIPVYNGYGLTETGPVISTNHAKSNRRGSVGRPIPGVQVKIIEGEIATRGSHIMAGYYRSPELTNEVLTSEGWLLTGDLGFLDEDGYLHINGRKKNLIVLSNGKKIHPEEVESVLSQSSQIKEICVVGLPSNSELGEKISAVVIPSLETLSRHDGNYKAIESEIRAEFARLSNDLAAYKRPNEIIIREEPFPLTAAMKIKRHALKDEILRSELRAHRSVS